MKTVQCSAERCGKRLEVPYGACATAPRICDGCRAYPLRLNEVRKLLELHMLEHRSNGDFERRKVQEYLIAKARRTYSGGVTKGASNVKAQAETQS